MRDVTTCPKVDQPTLSGSAEVSSLDARADGYLATLLQPDLRDQSGAVRLEDGWLDHRSIDARVSLGRAATTRSYESSIRSRTSSSASVPSSRSVFQCRLFM